MVLVQAGGNMFSSLYQYLLLYLRCVLKMWHATRLSFGLVHGRRSVGGQGDMSPLLFEV